MSSETLTERKKEDIQDHPEFQQNQGTRYGLGIEDFTNKFFDNYINIGFFSRGSGLNTGDMANVWWGIAHDVYQRFLLDEAGEGERQFPGDTLLSNHINTFYKHSKKDPLSLIEKVGKSDFLEYLNHVHGDNISSEMDLEAAAHIIYQESSSNQQIHNQFLKNRRAYAVKPTVTKNMQLFARQNNDLQQYAKSENNL